MNNTVKRGRLVVVSGPSGVGKGTVLKHVLENEDYVYSVSATTRKAREGEKDGENYFFISRDKFENMIENDELVEYAEYNGNYYGTPKFFVEQMLDQGKNVILEIEVNGAQQIKKKMPQSVFVFVAPESKDVLEQRLRSRATEPEEVINSRLSIAQNEVKASNMYDFIVVNKDGKSLECAKDILCAVRAFDLRSQNVYDTIIEFFK